MRPPAALIHTASDLERFNHTRCSKIERALKLIKSDDLFMAKGDCPWIQEKII